jgi:hypothetical protein
MNRSIHGAICSDREGYSGGGRKFDDVIVHGIYPTVPVL